MRWVRKDSDEGGWAGKVKDLRRRGRVDRAADDEIREPYLDVACVEFDDRELAETPGSRI